MSVPKKIAIVGSRRRDDQDTRTQIFNIVEESNVNTVFVTGGCLQGADRFCEEACARHGRVVVVFPAIIRDHVRGQTRLPRWTYTKAYHTRNKAIAEFADMCIAAVHKDRQGGTENTVRHFQKMDKVVLFI